MPPPPAQYFQGGVDGSNAFVPVLDTDGNWEAGVRLPHVSSTVLGRRAGAPLGTYDAINDAVLDRFNPFALISGTFTRFSDAEIRARYPTRQTYVRRVVLAAVSLAQRHYITGDDAEALIEVARNEPLPAGTLARQPRTPMRLQSLADHRLSSSQRALHDAEVARAAYEALHPGADLPAWLHWSRSCASDRPIACSRLRTRIEDLRRESPGHQIASRSCKSCLID